MYDRVHVRACIRTRVRTRVRACEGAHVRVSVGICVCLWALVCELART